jgi:hypothetical protein
MTAKASKPKEGWPDTQAKLIYTVLVQQGTVKSAAGALRSNIA